MTRLRSPRRNSEKKKNTCKRRWLWLKGVEPKKGRRAVHLQNWKCPSKVNRAFGQGKSQKSEKTGICERKTSCPAEGTDRTSPAKRRGWREGKKKIWGSLSALTIVEKTAKSADTADEPVRTHMDPKPSHATGPASEKRDEKEEKGKKTKRAKKNEGAGEKEVEKKEANERGAQTHTSRPNPTSSQIEKRSMTINHLPCAKSKTFRVSKSKQRWKEGTQEGGGNSTSCTGQPGARGPKEKKRKRARAAPRGKLCHGQNPKNS